VNFRPEGWPGCADTQVSVNAQISGCSGGDIDITGELLDEFRKHLAFA
jgi:hypothetical protein